METTNKLTWAIKEYKLAAWVEVGIGGVVWCATLDGHNEGQLYQPSTRISDAARKDGIVAAIGRVALTAERYATLEKRAARLAEEYKTSPEALRTEREDLCNAIRGALDDARDAREQAFEDDCAHGLPGYDTPAVAAAQQALANFDGTHPEIVAAIKVEREEAVKRNQWN